MSILPTLYNQKLETGELVPDADQQRAVAALSALDDALQQRSIRGNSGLFSFARKKGSVPLGLYFYGGVGRGKSMVMDLFFTAARCEKKKRVHFHAFMLEVHDFLHCLRQSRRKDEKLRIDGDLIACADHIAAETQLLCLDEFHVRDVADAMILGRLFTALFARGLVVVVTSNLAPDALYEGGLQRDRFLPFIALLKEKMELVAFTGETDYRLGRLRDAKMYFFPHDNGIHAEMQKLFSLVTDGAESAAGTIAVKGREIFVPQAAKEAAFFTFADLCETSKSALDYLALVKHYRVFFLENVPLLDDSRRDAVLRFITLVDTLYDHHVWLVMSAAAPPEDIYQGAEHAPAFARTISRLMEMQSRNYKKATFQT